jgi:hypothetical protein
MTPDLPSRSEALARHQRDMLRRRQLAKMLPSGGLSGRSGAAAPMPHQRTGGAVPKQIVQLQEPGAESVPVDQAGPLAVSESNNYPVRNGGLLTVIITLKTALTSQGEFTLSRNGTVFATEGIASGELLMRYGPYVDDRFEPGDLIQLSITNAGAGGSGFHAELRFS